MTWSLRLRHGDFVVEGAQYAAAIRQQKLVQDLRCAILERMGTDNLHPEFGSLIDGGVTPDGAHSDGVVGESEIDLAVLELESEINRIVRDHQGKQLARAKGDRATYGKPTLDPREVLIRLGGIRFIQNQDVLSVVISLITANDQSFEIQLPTQLNLADFN